MIGASYYWTNAAGRQWLLYEEAGKLRIDSAYGNLEVIIKLSDSGAIEALYFNGEPYINTQNTRSQNFLAQVLQRNIQNHDETKQQRMKVLHCSDSGKHGWDSIQTQVTQQTKNL